MYNLENILIGMNINYNLINNSLFPIVITSFWIEIFNGTDKQVKVAPHVLDGKGLFFCINLSEISVSEIKNYKQLLCIYFYNKRIQLIDNIHKVWKIVN